MFLSLDPGDADDILTQNGYADVNNNPVMLVDPDGHLPWLLINAGFAAYEAYKAYDLLSDTLLEIKKIYQEDLERMPTVAELEALILKALQLDSNINEQLGEMEIVDVNFKLKKKRKTPNIEPGIVFAIPLKEIEKYAYGLVVKGKGLKDDIYIQPVVLVEL